MAKKIAKKAGRKAAKKKAAKPAKKAVKKAATKAAKKVAKRPAKKAIKKAGAKKAAAPVEKRSTKVNPYINFRGNCEEAFNFYKSVFGGNFSAVNRFNEMPPMEGQPPMAESTANLIMHISLPISKETILMGSDVPESMSAHVTFGNSFGVSVDAASQSDADRIFNGLAAGGQVMMPIGKTFWGAYFGMLTDKYSVNWMVSFG